MFAKDPKLEVELMNPFIELIDTWVRAKKKNVISVHLFSNNNNNNSIIFFNVQGGYVHISTCFDFVNFWQKKRKIGGKTYQ